MTEGAQAEERLAQIRNCFNALASYPSLTPGKEAAAALKEIRKAYDEGDERMKGFILYTIHHYLARISEMKEMKSAEWARHVKKVEGEAVAPYVFSSVTSYFSSVEGSVILLRLLSKLKGPLPSKLLAYHLSYCLMSQSPLFKLLRNHCIMALGKARSTYALRTLLALGKGGAEEIEKPVSEAIMAWKERLERSKSSSAKKWLKALEKSFWEPGKKEGPYF